MKQSMRVLTTQTTVQWYTPSWLIEKCHEALGDRIGLDPASCAIAQETVRASVYFDAEINGLTMPWRARTVFLNPPFDATTKWVDKMTYEYRAGNFVEGILLVNSAPGYKWFEKLWREQTVCMLEKRVCFVKEDGTVGGAAKKGQVLVYFGPDETNFHKVFHSLGRIIDPERF